ncbi:MAG: SRPBCC domain-containing protein [Pseudomonadota bacterium]
MSKLTVTTPNDTTIKFERVFPAPRKKVFETYHDAEAMKQWYANPGYPVSEVETTFVVGGDLKIVWDQPDGGKMILRGKWLAYEPHATSTFTENWDEDWTGGEVVNENEFTDVDGGTLLTLVSTYKTKEGRDGAIEGGAAEGFGAALDALEAMVTTA